MTCERTGRPAPGATGTYGVAYGVGVGLGASLRYWQRTESNARSSSRSHPHLTVIQRPSHISTIIRCGCYGDAGGSGLTAISCWLVCRPLSTTHVAVSAPNEMSYARARGGDYTR